MTRAVLIKGHKTGPNTVELDEPLPEHTTEVEVLARVAEPVASPAQSEDDDPTGWKAVDSLIGIFRGTPPDMAENHNKYLYGFKK
jgi:hypothetical protein